MKYQGETALKSKLIDDNNTVVSNNFQIANNSFIADILSSKLYTKKIKAVVRELSSNALDAHISINKDNIPFEITAPTQYNCNFKVRDFGPGLSHEDILNLYSTYGNSNKRNTDSFIGGFGIGSKVGFAYTDVFHVISYHGGKKRTYWCYKDTTFPKIDLISTEICDILETGLEITIPVNRYDIGEFNKEIELVFEFYKVKPVGFTFKSKPNYTNSKDVIVVETDDFKFLLVKFYKCQEYFNNSFNSVIINNNILELPDEIVRKFNPILSNNRFFLFVKGGLDISASRESIENTKKNNAFFNVIIPDITIKLKERINSLLSEIELPSHKGQFINSFRLNANIHYDDNIEFPVYIGNENQFIKIFKCSKYNINWDNLWSRRSSEDIVNLKNIDLDDMVVIVKDDNKPSKCLKNKIILINSDQQYFFLVNSNNKKFEMKNDFFTILNTGEKISFENIESFLSYFDIENVTKTSEITDYVVQTVKKVKQEKCQFYNVNTNAEELRSMEEINKEDNYCIVSFNTSKVLDFAGNILFDHQFTKSSTAFNYNKLSIFGINTSKPCYVVPKSKLPKNIKFKNLFEELKTPEYYCAYRALHFSYNNASLIKLFFSNEFKYDILPNSYLNYINVKKTTDALVEDIQLMYNKLVTEFPLLKYANAFDDRALKECLNLYGLEIIRTDKMSIPVFYHKQKGKF